ncbi:hypothetical protein T484DRAFT_1926445 [Baffinella frigidus]|nr:hypothetical protein T484DRAFT_1926445 [Cryptophyta sp. CCMP2293]
MAGLVERDARYVVHPQNQNTNTQTPKHPNTQTPKHPNTQTPKHPNPKTQACAVRTRVIRHRSVSVFGSTRS